MKKNKTGAVILGVAFVWFTTHFGGGFASGAQIYSYFVRYGIWCLIMPVFAMLYNTVFFAYSLRFARKHQVYDYRSYNNAFYGRFAPIFSNLFEILYVCVMCVAPAVAFATGGATLSTLTGLPYLLCTFLIGVFIFVGCHIRHRSGAESSIRTVHLHYRGTADRIYSQYHFRLIGNLGGCGEYDKGRAAVWRCSLLGVSLRNIPALQHCGVCTACEII